MCRTLPPVLCGFFCLFVINSVTGTFRSSRAPDTRLQPVVQLDPRAFQLQRHTGTSPSTAVETLTGTRNSLQVVHDGRARLSMQILCRARSFCVLNRCPGIDSHHLMATHWALQCTEPIVQDLPNLRIVEGCKRSSLWNNYQKLSWEWFCAHAWIGNPSNRFYEIYDVSATTSNTIYRLS